MMLRQSIWAGLLALLMAAPLSMDNDTKEEMQKDVQSYMITKGYCDMDEFEEMDYYLFCGTQLHKRGSGDGSTCKQSIIGSETKSIEEAKELYQEFIKKLPLDSVEEDEEGNLLAGTRDNYSLLTIRKIEDGTEQWSFSLQGIQEEVARIRDDVREGDRVLVEICQFEGNENEGWLTVQAGDSSFFRIAYPSGEVTYLGEYMYAISFSPDGKYVAYSSDVDYDSGVGMTDEEYDKMERICPPGICVREIETGKTAYIYWDPYKNPEEDFMEYRSFSWIEKESFEEYMGEP